MGLESVLDEEITLVEALKREYEALIKEKVDLRGTANRDVEVFKMSTMGLRAGIEKENDKHRSMVDKCKKKLLKAKMEFEEIHDIKIKE